MSEDARRWTIGEHSRKFAARAQAATTASHPVLLRVWADAGHGGTNWSTIVAQQTDWLAFVMRELGLRPSEDVRQTVS
ncbi:hypothetical protein ACIBQ1_46985 [Nonomuraea sp. NPDC050153]|uniref:hypothetical protein n=1 Tax=Nonomuraea sp. NPDC050153 TaxID=3364359 RepID=UPI0037B2C132